ncbi:MAG: hypothetical protein ACRDOZ_13740, partial [Nocardioides sp.]
MTNPSDQGLPEFEQLGDMVFEPTACPVCGDTETRRPLRKKFRGHTLHFGTCTSCETLYMNPRMTRESLRTVYDSEEFY